MTRYIRIQLAIGLCLALVGIVIVFALVPAIMLAFDDRRREMHGDQLIDEQLWQAEVESLVMRIGTITAIAGGLIAFNAWIIGIMRPKKPA